MEYQILSTTASEEWMNLNDESLTDVEAINDCYPKEEV